MPERWIPDNSTHFFAGQAATPFCLLPASLRLVIVSREKVLGDDSRVAGRRVGDDFMSLATLYLD